jgi:hypothetical protein
MNDNGAVTNYSPNLLNQYTSTAGNSFSYDGNFNMTHTAGFYGVYDAANRLVSASSGGSGESGQAIVTFVYDGLGRCERGRVGSRLNILTFCVRLQGHVEVFWGDHFAVRVFNSSTVRRSCSAFTRRPRRR